MVKRDSKLLLEKTEEVCNRGVDMRRLAEDIAFQVRHVFVAKVSGNAPAELGDADRDAVVALAREADTAQLARIFDVVHSSIWEIARASQPRLAFEMSLLKALHLAPAASIPDLISRVEKLSGPSSAVAGASGGRSGQPTFRT